MANYPTLPAVLTRRQKEDVLRGHKLFTPAEVAHLFQVDPKTVTRWAKAGKLAAIRTIGGHRRYAEKDIRSLYESGGGVWPF